MTFFVLGQDGYNVALELLHSIIMCGNQPAQAHWLL